MPTWFWIAIGVGSALVLGVAGYFAWRAAERRYLLRVVGRLQAVEAIRSALTESCTRLAGSTGSELADFAEDPDFVERHALSAVANHATVLVEELDTMPVPTSLTQAAETVADAAFAVARESGRVREEHTGEEVLDALIRIDLEFVTAYVDRAREAVLAACEVCGLDDQAVYGGGLYL